MGHDELFAKVVPYTMEEMGVLEFFQALTSDLKYNNPKMGKWFVSGSRHYSWDKVINKHANKKIYKACFFSKLDIP